jgi:antiviral helicase SKI2
MYAIVRSEALLSERLRALSHQLSDANLTQMPEFQQRVEVLQRLEYVATDNTVQLKGRVACEINSGDELVATELIFAGVLSELTPEEAVAVLSALVFQEKSEVHGCPTERLAAARDDVIELATAAGRVQKECGLDIIPDEYCRSVLKFGLMEVVYEWAKGTPFEEICQLTNVMEGSIVRAIVRLDETCREFRDAARVMGNTHLFQQMRAASALIKRDVIFAASLYVA